MYGALRGRVVDYVPHNRMRLTACYSSIMNAATALLRLGWSVIPLGAITKTGDKKKIIYPVKWTEYQKRLATEEEVQKWAHFPNMGVVSGRLSGVLVLDSDEYKPTFDRELLRSFHIPVTPCQQTASGGKQYFFKWPKGVELRNDVCIGHKGSGIDVRGEGGMVVVAPSKTNYGEYSWILDPFETELAEVPPKLLELLIGARKSGVKERKNLSDLVGLTDGGGRNNALTSFIGKMLMHTPWNEWDTEVWPMAVELNKTYKPPLDRDELESVYNSVTHIETERRLKEQAKEAPKQLAVRKSFRELITQSFPDNRFALAPFFEQGTMNMVSAPPNTWKSWMFFLMAKHIADGSDFLGKFKAEKAKVLIVNEEDTERLIADRFRALDITDENLEIFFRTAQGSKLDTGFCKSLITECKTDGITVVMFDSLRAMHDADENSSTAMQPILDNMKMMTREGITVVFTHHHKKKNPFDRGDTSESSRGSSAINAAISGHISLEEVEKDEGRFLVVRHLKSKVTQKLEPFEIKINVSDGKVGFTHTGVHQDTVHLAKQASEAVYEELRKDSTWMSVKDFTDRKVAQERYARLALTALVKLGLAQKCTRAQLEKDRPDLQLPGARKTNYYKWTGIEKDEQEESKWEQENAFENLDKKEDDGEVIF